MFSLKKAKNLLVENRIDYPLENLTDNPKRYSILYDFDKYDQDS
jgi:hypothetical protein